MTDRITRPLYVQQIEAAIFSLKQIEYRLPNSKAWNQATAKQVTALRPFIPYCILSAGAGNEITPSILINRDYKPIGITEPPKAVYKTWVDYKSHPWAHFEPPAGMTDQNGRHYFFGDGSAPWNSRHGLDRFIKELEDFLERCTAVVEEEF